MEIRVRIEKDFDKVLRAAERSNDLSLRRAGAYVRGVAMKGIKTSKGFSKPGDRPHTRKGRLRKSIIFAVDQKGVNVLIGPHSGAIGKVGATHEFGGTEEAIPSKERSLRGNARTSLLDSGGMPIKVAGTNWILGPGGHGPIEVLGDNDFRYAKLLTFQQIRRAQVIAIRMISGRALGVHPGKYSAGKPKRTYPKRAFMRPTLDLVKDSLPDFWYQSVRG